MKLFSNLICAVTRHKYYSIRKLDKDTRKIGCSRCGKEWAMYYPSEILVEWDLELEALYAPGGILEKLK